MLELRFHSRGGQGGVIAGKLLAVAFDIEGKYVQTFPSFGVERRAAPVQTFLRVDDKPIRIRNQVYTPDMLIVMDPSLIAFTPVLTGLKDDGTIIVNSERNADHFDFHTKYKTISIWLYSSNYQYPETQFRNLYRKTDLAINVDKPSEQVIHSICNELQNI